MEKEELMKLINENINSVVELRDYFDKIDALPFLMTKEQIDVVRSDLKTKIDILGKQTSNLANEFDTVPIGKA